MNKYVSFKRNTDGKYVYVTINKNFEGERNTPIKYRFKNEEEFKSQYMSEENLTYHMALTNENEEDEYLLNIALQNDKKLCATFFTNNPKKIEGVFSDKTRYNVRVKRENKYYIVFVARKGSLEDYYDIDEVDECYDRHNVILNPGIFEPMCKVEMIDLLSGNYNASWTDVKYQPFISFEGDDVLFYYKSEGLAITGLLLGYPLESTVSLIDQISGVYEWFKRI